MFIVFVSDFLRERNEMQKKKEHEIMFCRGKKGWDKKILRTNIKNDT